MAGEDTGGQRTHQGHSRSGLHWGVWRRADDQSVFNLLRLIDFKTPEAFHLLASLTNAFTYVRGAIRSPHVWPRRWLDSSGRICVLSLSHSGPMQRIA